MTVVAEKKINTTICDVCGHEFYRAPLHRIGYGDVCEYPPVGAPSCMRSLCTHCVRWAHPTSVSGLRMSFCPEHHEQIKKEDPSAER